MKKRILIIGGTGFLGYHIAKKCLKLSWDVVIVSLRKHKVKKKIKKIRYIQLDTSKRRFDILKKFNFDYVINSSGYVEHKNIRRIKKGHYLSVKNLYTFFKSRNIKSFIQIGSSAEYGNTKMPHKETFNCKPLGIYGKYKLKATKFLISKFKNNSFPVTVLRLYQLYGPNQDENRFVPILISSCVKRKNFFTSSGTQKRDFLYVSDAVEAIIKSLISKNSKGKIINIGYGKSIMLKKVMQIVKQKTGFFEPVYGKIKLRTDEKKDIYPDISVARKVLNWKPNVSLESGILKTVNYFKKIY